MLKSRLKLAVLAVALTALFSAAALSAATADAGKPGGKGGSGASISLNETDPHLGDTVTFTTSGGSSITVNCFQGGLGNLVYAARQPTGTAFVLGGGDSAWQSGPATCVVYLYTRRLVAQTSFEAAGAR